MLSQISLNNFSTLCVIIFIMYCVIFVSLNTIPADPVTAVIMITHIRFGSDARSFTQSIKHSANSRPTKASTSTNDKTTKNGNHMPKSIHKIKQKSLHGGKTILSINLVRIDCMLSLKSIRIAITRRWMRAGRLGHDLVPSYRSRMAPTRAMWRSDRGLGARGVFAEEGDEDARTGDSTEGGHREARGDAIQTTAKAAGKQPRCRTHPIREGSGHGNIWKWVE